MRIPDITLASIRVIEFTHMVMGPTCGMVLADLGAEVIKIEPMKGEHTRHLLGSGAGVFPMFNRNKESIAIDLKIVTRLSKYNDRVRVREWRLPLLRTRLMHHKATQICTHFEAC